MSDRNRQRIEVALLALAFGMGGGWAAFELRLGNLEEKVVRIDQRVTAMYCAQVRQDLREACR